MEKNSGGSGVRFLSFANDTEDAKKEAKLKEAAAKIEQSIARSKALDELIDYKPPDESVDPATENRSLYERLEEQRNKKQAEAEESQKLSNLVTKLDEDEVSYLNDVSRMKQEEEIKKRLEVYDALQEKKRSLQKRELEEERRRRELLSGFKFTTNNKSFPSSSSSLKSKLSSVIKVRPKASDTTKASEMSPSVKENVTGQKRQVSEESTLDLKRPKTNEHNHQANDSDAKTCSTKDNDCTCVAKHVMTCIGVLPSLPMHKKGLTDSDDSDNSDDDLDCNIIPRFHRKK